MTTVRRIWLVLAAVGVLGFGLAACGEAGGDRGQVGDDETRTQANEQAAVDAASGATAEEADRSGEVTLTGTVSSRLADRAFFLENPVAEDGTPMFDDEIAVIVTGSPTSVTNDATVRVTGMLHVANIEDEVRALEQHLGIQVPGGLDSILADRQLLVAGDVTAT